MKHFGEASWIDLARGAVPPDVQTTMLRHVDDGCAACRRTMQVWQGVSAIAKMEENHTPPGDIVRVVKSQLAALPHSKGRSLIRLLFDSELQPAMTGVRGAVPARQLLYETDEFSIDLRLEIRRTERRVYMVGQILSRSAVQGSGNELPVRLYGQHSQLTESVTNRFGEFQLEYHPIDSISLAIGEDEHTRITLPHIDLTP